MPPVQDQLSISLRSIIISIVVKILFLLIKVYIEQIRREARRNQPLGGRRRTAATSDEEEEEGQEGDANPLIDTNDIIFDLPPPPY